MRFLQRIKTPRLPEIAQPELVAAYTTKKRSYSVVSKSRWNYALHRMEIRVTIGLGKNKNSTCIEFDVHSIAFALEMYATLYKRSQVETALVHVYEIASGHLTNARLARPYPPLALQKWTRSCTSYELYLNKCSSFSLSQ